MRGHGKIIEARMKRKVPPFVFVNDYPCKTDWFEYGEHATVCTAGDALSGMDFRFLTELKVSISALSEGRAKAIFERVKAAGASVVAACHVVDGCSHHEQTGWSQVWRKEVANG
jgi:hypothetical protein